MHESLVYKLNLIARVSSPSTRNNIIDPRWGEYAVDNYRITSKRQLYTLNTYIDTLDTDNHMQHITNYQNNIYTTGSQRILKEAIAETLSAAQ